MLPSSDLSFGELLKQLRKRAGMTQADLGAAVGYSVSFISNLELDQRLPDVQVIVQHFIPALGLQGEVQTARALIERAAAVRGQRPPAAITVQRTTHLVVEDEIAEVAGQLPAPQTELIGRREEIQALGQRLLGHRGRLLTLMGPPGIGKTRLAQAVAARLQPHYPQGAVFVSLAAIGDATMMAATLADAVGAGEGNAKPPKTRLIEALRRKTMLVVLDNCEQIVDAAPLVAEVLAECAGLTILATSRERLHLRAEQRYKVPPLALGAAVELFTQRAGVVNPDFVLTATNRPTVEAICQRLDRLPLAIELCAAQLDMLSPSQLLAGLQRSRLDLLVDGAQDLPPRQRTLRAAIGWSYSLLTDRERTLFRSLGVFRGGFALPEIATVIQGRLERGDFNVSAGHPSGANDRQVSDDPIPQALVANLKALITKSLVQVETLPSGEQHFLLLETLREFALEQVHTPGEEAELRQRHYLAYLHLFRTGDGYLRGTEAIAWFARLEPELDNVRAALQWTLDAARYADAAWLLIAGGYFWASTGRRYEAAKWLATLLPYRQAFPVDLRLTLLIDFSFSASDSGEFPDLDQYRAEMVELMDRCPSKQLQVMAWYFLAESDADQARGLALACAASEEPALGPEFGGHADADWLLALTQLGYGDRLFDQGEIAEATALVSNSLQRFRRRGNYAFIADCLGILGNFAWLRGDITTAYTHLQEIVILSTTHNLPQFHAGWQWLLGLVTLYGGNATEARRLLEAGLQHWLPMKDTVELARVCMGLAETAFWEDDLEQAAGWLGQSLAYHPSPQRITMFELQRLFIAGRLATAQGQYQRAATLFGLADAAHHQLHCVYAGPMSSLVETALATVREGLDPIDFAEAFAAGQQLSLEEVYATFLAPSQVVGAPTMG